MRSARLPALIVTVGLVIALPAVANAKHGDTATGKANLHPLPLTQVEDNGAQPRTLSGVSGKFLFVDDGSTISISGEARGLDPAATYVSSVSDRGSVPGGFFAFGGQGATKGACEVREWEDPVGIVGVWSVDADGQGTISGTNFVDSQYVGLDEIGTVSIVQVEPDLGVEGVVACGRVTTHGAG